MGWNWAMFIAQRIHQHQVMLGCGLPHDQVLADGRPAPNMSTGKTLIVPYADNLNVIGTCKKDVQDVKDRAVARLRQVGFRVHEEEDACSEARALGFVIDGKNCRVHPLPEKRDRAIAALRWLAGRPKVDGRCLERIIGHCIHFFMLRREFLSIFRSVYDFKVAHYKSPSRLWRTAAAECKWAASLLWICQSDLAKPWSPTVTVSDACLSGTATCSLDTDPLLVQDIASTRELWRYKGKYATVKARDAIKKLDPFSDIRTAVKPEVFDDPFQLNEEFANVPEELSCSQDWRLLFSSQMHFKEHITLLEGRATIQSIRHITRSIQNFNQRHLHLGDNLGMVLAFDRGRAKSVPLLLCCRKACAYSVASGCLFSHRWIPSEHNAADSASRFWEKAGSKDISKNQIKKVRDNLIYPKRGKVQSHWNGGQGSLPFGHPCLETSSAPRGAIHDSRQDARAEAVHSCEGSKRQNSQEGKHEKDIKSCAKVCGADSPGILCRFPQHSAGLLQKSPRFSELLPSTGVEHHECYSGRPLLDRVPEPGLLRGIGHLRGKQVLCGSSGSFSICGEDRLDQKQKGPKRMEKSRSRTVQDTSCLATCGIHCDGPLAAGQSPGSFVCADNVHHLHAPIRSSKITQVRPSGVSPSSSELGPELERAGRGQPFKSRPHRRDDTAGQPSPALHRTCSPKAGSGGSTRSSFWTQLSGPSSSVAPSTGSHRPRARLCSALPAQAFRSLVGSFEKAAQHSGHQAEGKMVIGQQPEALRVPCKSSSDVREVAASSSQTSGGIASIVKGNGYRIFCPVNPNQKKPILELYAGCASLSKSLCRHGFTVHAYDVQWGSGGNVLDYNVFQKLCNSISSGYFSFVHFGMPCESWSRARKWDGGPQPLRNDSSHLYGFTDLVWYDELKVKRCNTLLQTTYKLALACINSNVPWTLENPATSRAWLTDELLSLEQRGAFKQLTHYCQYGKRWRKATFFMCWNVPVFHLKQCTGSHGWCNSTQRRHFVLQGRNSKGTFHTLFAQPYPSELCDHISSALAVFL